MDVLSDVIAAMRTGRPHANRTQRQAPWAFRGDTFSGAGFHVVLQGSCLLTPERGDSIPLDTDDVVCLLPHAPAYSLAVKDDSTVLLCGAYMLDQSRAHPLLAELPEIVHLAAGVDRHQGLSSAITLLGSELAEPRPGGDAITSALLDMLLLYILRAWYDEQAGKHSTSGWAAALADPAISAALRAMHHEPGHPWTVEELGARAGLSRAAFARRFAVLIGQPPLTYLTWWRMITAAQLLRGSDAPLGSVAARTGYSSEFAFSKAFKREYGMAPGGYRRAASR